MTTIAILVSDIHLSLKPPVARSAEPDWLLAMKRPLDEIRTLAKDHKAIICYAGDIFDHWNAPASLINWAIENLPPGFSVAGQHDLPFHNYSEIGKTAYHTLCQAGVLTHLDAYQNTHKYQTANIELFGFSWELPLKPPLKRNSEVNLAVVHKYIWSEKKNRHGGVVSKKSNITEIKELKDYTAAVFGDNHIGFLTTKFDCNVINCGSLMCRTSDQRNYSPMVGLLNHAGIIIPHQLDTTKDKWIDSDDAKKKTKKNIDLLIKQYKNISRNHIDFLKMLRREATNKTHSKEVRTILLELMETAQNVK